MPTNSAIGPSPVQRRAATSKNPTTCTLPSDVISHNLIHHLLMVALVWTVNSTLSWGCNYVMQLNLGWSVATAKTKTAAHTFCMCLCWNKVMSPIRQKRQISEFHIFAPPNAAPCTVLPGMDAPLRPPSRRHYLLCI